MRVLILGSLLWVFAALVLGQDDAYSPPYYPSPLTGRIKDESWDEALEKARKFVGQLSLVEKVNLTTGVGWMQGPCVGNTGDLPRLGFDGFCLQDGPLGVRNTDFNTAFPPGISVGASFNKTLMYERAKAIALEHKHKGVDIMLGPCTGPIGLKAAAGRIWEAFGADPYLQGIAGAVSVEGIQDQGVIANAKHFIGNEQEHFRIGPEWKGLGFDNVTDSVSSNIDDRALHEIYVWPFADMIQAGVGSIMCSYNQINNSYGCQNSYMLNKVAKEELGFTGFIMSDWGADMSGVAAVLAGLDMNMPGDGAAYGDGASYLGKNLTTMVLNGTVPEWRVDDMATRIMAAYYRVGVDQSRKEHPDGPNFYSWSLNDTDYIHPGAGGPDGSGDKGEMGLVNKHVNVQTKYSRQTAMDVAREAIVLLKNDQSDKNSSTLLPLKNVNKISVFGIAAGPDPAGVNCAPDLACSNGALGGGWGSGQVNFPFLSTPLEAISQRCIKEGISILSNTEYDPAPGGQFDLYARYSDVNIIFGLTDSGEGFASTDDNLGDRKNTSLWHNADSTIKKAASLNKNNVVVVSSVGPVNLEQWIEHPNISAVLFTPPGGQYAGEAITEVLFGDYNPSGRLPFTIAKNDDDYVPIVDQVTSPAPQDNFDRGFYLDYRYFDNNNIEPRYEFGYGLSYSKFKFGNLKVSEIQKPSLTLPKPPSLKPPHFYQNSSKPDPESAVFPSGFNKIPYFEYPYIDSTSNINSSSSQYPYPEGYSTTHRNETTVAGGGPGGNPALFKDVYSVQATIKNEGTQQGSYVAQLYVGYPRGNDTLDTPPKQLRGFDKVNLAPGQSTTVKFNLRLRDISVWDVVSQSWIVQKGKYTIYVGSSSRNTELKQTIDI